MTDECEYPNEVQRFYYETLKWCGCGNPDEALGFMRDLMALMKARSDENTGGFDEPYAESAWAKRTAEIDAMLGDGMLGLSYLYMLDSHDLTEHGGSVGGSWLTQEGERVLAMLQSVDLDAAMHEGFG